MSDETFEYRVMFRHYDDTICEYSAGLSEEAARRDAERGSKSDREFWIERRPVAEWERAE